MRRMPEQVQALMGSLSKVGMKFQFEIQGGILLLQDRTAARAAASWTPQGKASLKVFSPKDGEGGGPLESMERRKA